MDTPNQNSEKMAKTEHYYTQFFPDCYYHIYNRAVDKKPMFLSDENYRFFLKRYDKYLSPVATTYSYALCGNHFHFGIKIKSAEDLTNFENLSNLIGRYKTVHELVSHRFQIFFLSYAKAFNKQHGRVGTLFQTPFKRCLVDTEDKLFRMLYYHHANPQRHKLCSDFREYPWTSYSRYLNNQTSKLPKGEVFKMMGGKDRFIQYHDSLKWEIEKEDSWFIES